jgi:endonuclease G
MFRRSLFGLGFVLLLLVCGSRAHADPTQCPSFYAGAEAPKIIEPTLRASVIEVCHHAYGAAHSGQTLTPLWSAEHLTTASVIAAEAQPRVGDFHEESLLPPSGRSTLDDYHCSGFDRGHMTPAGDEGTDQDSRESFSLANMVPQDPYLNQRLWAGLEEATRKLAKAQGEAFVVTGPLYATPSPLWLHTRVAVPTHTFKAVYVPDMGASAYVARNWPVESYLVLSIAELTELLGIDPFPALPKEVKAIRIDLPPPDASAFHNVNLVPCHRAARDALGRPSP